jgi:hypothetical protein
MAYCVIVGTLVVILVALREPRLGRGEDEAIDRALPAPSKTVGLSVALPDHTEDDRHEPGSYDVNVALRSDEALWGDVPAEGEGPARRRYLRDDVPSVIPGTIRLVR